MMPMLARANGTKCDRKYDSQMVGRLCWIDKVRALASNSDVQRNINDKIDTTFLRVWTSVAVRVPTEISVFRGVLEILNSASIT